MSEIKTNFLKVKQDQMGILGFWDESYKSILIALMESSYKTDVIIDWGISDIVITGDKVLIKWFKRIQPLSAEQLKEKYGR